MKHKEKDRKRDRERRTGICPFYKYKATDRSEIVTCEVTRESVAFPDVESFTKFVTKMPFCLEIDFYDCPKYKRKMKETPSDTDQ